MIQSQSQTQNKRRREPRRILSIDPTIKGFGYVVMEGLDFLVDWGIKEARERKNERCLKQIRGLLAKFKPDLIIFEDTGARGSRRCSRVRDLLDRVADLAAGEGVAWRAVSRKAVKKAFASQGATTQYEIAKLIARRFPELADRLPPYRNRWMPMDARMSLFQAVGRVVATRFRRGGSILNAP